MHDGSMVTYDCRCLLGESLAGPRLWAGRFGFERSCECGQLLQDVPTWWTIFTWFTPVRADTIERINNSRTSYVSNEGAHMRIYTLRPLERFWKLCQLIQNADENTKCRMRQIDRHSRMQQTNRIESVQPAQHVPTWYLRIQSVISVPVPAD